MYLGIRSNSGDGDDATVVVVAAVLSIFFKKNYLCVRRLKKGIIGIIINKGKKTFFSLLY
jgi:hypothetical protein